MHLDQVVKDNLVYVFRLHRMHEMHTIVTDVRGVCQSSRLYCAKMGEQIKMLFSVNTPGGSWIIVLDVGLDPPQRGEGGPLLNFGIKSYLRNGWS